MTGQLSPVPLIAAIPVGLLVIGILHGNNFRDLVEDVKAGYKTIAFILGVKGSSIYYAILVTLAYFLIMLLTILKILPWQTLLVFLTIPMALRNIKLAFRPDYLQFGLLDLFTAKLHLSFGLLMALGLFVAKLSYGG
jgi:1,4-dihydroxy-2-naphthoate octaprenyltransferase